MKGQKRRVKAGMTKMPFTLGKETQYARGVVSIRMASGVFQVGGAGWVSALLAKSQARKLGSVRDSGI